MSLGTTLKESQDSIGKPRGRAKAAPASKNDSPVAELVDLALIDEPALAIRDTMDEVQLAELCDSIAAVGIIEPLVVEQHGTRYKVMAGHRRLIACQALKYSPVPCVVRQAGEIDPAAITLAENYYRENVNPADEAVFLDRVLNEKCNGDTDVLAALIRHKREYVEDRLLLLRGDQNVLAALKGRQITLAVARELQRVKSDDQRLHFLDAAIRGGATAAIVRNWRTQGEQENPASATQDAAGAVVSAPAAAVAVQKMECFFCGGADNPHMMLNLWAHSYCHKALERNLNSLGTAEPNGKA